MTEKEMRVYQTATAHGTTSSREAVRTQSRNAALASVYIRKARAYGFRTQTVETNEPRMKRVTGCYETILNQLVYAVSPGHKRFSTGIFQMHDFANIATNRSPEYMKMYTI